MGGGRRGEEMLKCNGTKGFGVFGPQVAGHILTPVAGTELYNYEKTVNALFYNIQITQPDYS